MRLPFAAIEACEWENIVKTVFYINYELEVWLSSKGAWRRNRACLVGTWRLTRACLVVSVGSVFAGPLVVGPSVELLRCSTSGSWDSNTSTHSHIFRGIVKSRCVYSWLCRMNKTD
jgi:hypothetical protein